MIKRYDMYSDDGEMIPITDGDWVKHKDVQPLLDALNKIKFTGDSPRDMAIAMEALNQWNGNRGEG